MDETFGQMPEQIAEALKTKGIYEHDVKVAISFDRDLDMYPFEGYILITGTLLYVVSAKKERSTYSIDRIRKYDISKISRTNIFPQVTGGVFIIEYEDEDVAVAAFSNARSKHFHKLKGLLDKLANGQKVSEEDFTIKKEKGICSKCKNPFPDPERRVCPKCMDKRSLFLRILGYFTPYKFHFAAIITCIVLHSGMSVILPYLSGKVLYDEIIAAPPGEDALFVFRGRSQITALIILVGMLLAVRLVQQLFGIIQGRIVAGFVPKAILKIKSDVYNSMQNLSLSFFNKRRTGSLLTRVQNDASEVLSFFIDGLPYLVINIIILVMATVVMFSMNALLAVFSMFFIPLLFVISYSMIPRLWHLHGKRHRSVRNMNSSIQDNITGARVVKAFGREDNENERFVKISSRVRSAQLNEVTYDNKFTGLYTGVETFSLLVIWGLGSWLVINRPETMTYGMLISFVGYAAMLNGPLDFMSFMFRWWAQSLNSAQRIFEIVDAIPEVDEDKNPVRKGKFEGKIELRNVSFSYSPEKPVLNNINFTINPGEFFGIVGKTGAGKTTIINLISRFYDPTEGEIFIDDIPLKKIAFEDLRKNIAVVSQDTYIFKGTIGQNIAYAKPDCTRQEILFASMAASAHDFISKLTHGYDTIVGTGGKDLSGGEKQRISIARAILADPEILILDEATASVDTMTEQRIQRSVKKLIKGRTTISIAHRLSTLKEADRMIVIEDAGVAEQGTHDQLIRARGAFYDLMQLQTKALAMKGADE